MRSPRPLQPKFARLTAGKQFPTFGAAVVIKEDPPSRKQRPVCV
jgi:hypothetical protein